MDCLQLPFIRLEEAVSGTQRCLTRPVLPKEVYFRQTNWEANVCRNSTFQVNGTKNDKKKNHTLPRATEPPFLSALHKKNDTTNLFGYKLGESTEKKLYFSSQVQCKKIIQTFNGSI